MYYVITPLSSTLYFIRWQRQAAETIRHEPDFLEDLKALLDAAETPIYFLSDLREGRIINHMTLQRLGQLTRHANWGGGAAFSEDPLTRRFMGVFARFSEPEKREDNLWKTPEEAIAYLESLCEGVSAGVDWDSVFPHSAHSGS